MKYYSVHDIAEAYLILPSELQEKIAAGEIVAEKVYGSGGTYITRIPETELVKLKSLKIRKPKTSEYVQDEYIAKFTSGKKTIEALPTYYKGIKFRSRLEARWAIFFDRCGIKWEYEPEGYLLEDGTCYRPDFLLHGLVGRVEGDLFVEVKGKLTDEDAKKISMFINGKKGINPETYYTFARPLLLVGNIFTHNSNKGYIEKCFTMWMDYPGEVEYFSYGTIDGDCFGCVLGLNHHGEAETFGADSSYTCMCDEDKTEAAFQAALNARFDLSGNYEGK